MEKIKTDILVIGGGSGGLSVAAGAVQMGATVTLLEGHKMGGDCLNYGCVPSKALLAAGKQNPPMTFGGAKDHVHNVVATIAPHDSVERFEGLGVNVIEAPGRFVSPRTVQAGDTEITARRIVVATGSSPFVPPIPGLDKVDYFTNENIFDLRDQPKHLIIIGGGPIGMEMAQAHVRLGSQVTVIEGMKAFGKDDPELAAIVLQNIRNEGVTVLEDCPAQSVEKTPNGIVVNTDKGPIKGTHLLVAVGRKVNVDGLDLDKAGVEFDRRGIKVDASLRSISNRRVYAIGDVAGGLQFTHVAGYHAGVIIRSMLLALPAKASTNHIPWCTYTSPELAQVGLSEAQAVEKYGNKVTVCRADIGANDRAVAEGIPEGMVKVMVVKGRPVGASIVGPGAGEMIGLWAMAIVNNLEMSAVSATVMPYPTLGEVSKRAAGAYFSPKLFENSTLKKVVRFVQAWVP
ncbi:MAG: dihydrolipoyl dehydrogenase family protein [Planktomarina sp.]